MPAGKASKTSRIYKLKQHSRRKSRPYYTIAIAIALFIGCISLVVDYAIGNDQFNSPTIHHISKRAADNSTPAAIAETTKLPYLENYPKDLFTLKQWRQGAVLLHIAGMIYMFVALAIVCDEFFVPALEVITEKLELTEDVAGATFMAAGGSAPELFTSIAGLFISQNSVGISTIIGSAVFNILFVIGACGIAARGILQLTWWPLFRDSCFYSVSLLVLIISYYDWKIHYYEALALLLCYALYVTFMYFNARIEKKVKSALCCRTNENANIDLVPVSSNVSLKFMTNGGEKLRVSLHDKTRSRPSSSLKFRAGLLQLMIHTIDPLAEGNIEDQASQLRKLATQKTVPDEASSPTSTGAVDRNGNTPDAKNLTNGNSRAHSAHSAMGSTTSNHSSMTAVESIEDETSVIGNNTLHPTPAKTTKVETTASTNGFTVQVTANTADLNPSPTPVDEDDDDGDDENAPLDLSWPKTFKKRFSYIMLAPIIYPLWLTLPDTRRPERRKFYPVTFILSIGWIAAFSILMVWWASVICVAIHMPVEIIGLTVLAAGTSVPDLLTSVIVARKGYGDMAVSSSIGSNIFDITVGLPLPWIIQCLLNIPNAFVKVDAAGLFCSIILLFLMLLSVIGTVAAFKWKLSKPLGATYLLLYLSFLAISILLSLDIIPCIDVGAVIGA